MSGAQHNVHPMQTQGKKHDGLIHSRDSDISSVPKTVKSALKHLGFSQVMQEELDALYENSTWTLVPRHVFMNVVGTKWVFKTKLKAADGSLEWLKAQLVAKGYNQIEGVNFDETFSFVVRPPTIRIVLAVALSCRGEICQLDVKNAFLRIS